MKTCELIELLKQEDQNAEVLIDVDLSSSFSSTVLFSIDAINHAPGDLTHAQTIISVSVAE